ncbi:hypothetical protein ETU08_04195 [Apibacter muscae]|uniref:Uncharacterized protein n=1 Tax=Apibacter muscae TaxID=2509004 RepID=A0A563DGC5_9FLAO|nr:hypothetical protein ETU09_04565 [Apibacter muscae]TWP30300.1 hypothetical protein ETU08_04195 [Apibacter muscae]
MKKLLLFTLIINFYLISCKSGDKNESTKQEEITYKKPTPPKSEGPIRVLFVGNSHTEFIISYPKILEALAKANDKKVEIETLLEMGVSVDKILSYNKSKAEKLFAKKDTDGNYFDYVIIQESTPVAIDETDEYLNDSKKVIELISKNSPEVATYIYELASPFNVTDSDFNSIKDHLSKRAQEVAKQLTNAEVLPIGTILASAYNNDKGYTAVKDGKDLLRNTDNSKHPLNDAGFLNSIVIYKFLFGETPKIPNQLPLAKGNEPGNFILQDVDKAVSNPKALEEIAASFK